MIKRLTNPTTYEIITNRGRYAVSLDRIKNTVNGGPRFEAIITVLDVFGETVTAGGFYSARYRFSGHYCSERDEAAQIVNVYEDEIKE